MPLTWSIDVGSGDLPADLPDLWRRDRQCNPFASPTFLRVMHAAAARTDTPIWGLGHAPDGSLAAAWPLRLDREGALRFLPVGYSDQNSCLAHADVDESELASGLALAVAAAEARSLVLVNVPPWGPTLSATRQAARRLRWPHRSFPAWACPVLRVPTGQGASEALRHAIESHKRLRGYANALRRVPGYAFEVIEDNRDLAAWCEEFCDVHERRWSGTPTPSVYGSPTARALLRETFESWCVDGVLVRFAIRLAGERIAFVAALRAGRRLIYYHVVRSPEAEERRAGHVIIRLIALWMSERGYDTLDFGAGGEDYKSRYANADDRLWRVYAASRVLSATYARAVIEERIRRSTMLQRGWRIVAQRRSGELRRWTAAISGRSTARRG